MPITRENFWFVRAYCQEFCSLRYEFLVAISQARQLRAAVWSQKSAQESQHDHFLTPIG